MYTPVALGHLSVTSSSLTAEDIETIYGTYHDIFAEFGGAAESHFCWKSSHPSIFISLFASRQHADNRTLWYSDSSGGEASTVCEISAAMLTRS